MTDRQQVRKRARRTALALLAWGLCGAAGAAAAAKEFEVTELAPGVHGIVWKEPLADPIEGNSLVIINDRDVVVVDSALLPSSAKRLAAEVKRLTPKPVRYVVNTHWHDDHHLGNQVYAELWPGVEFIAHRHTRADAIEKTHHARPQVLEGMRNDLETLEGWLVTGKDDSGKEIDSARRGRVVAFVEMYKATLPELESIRATTPDLTFEDALVLQRGERTIEIRWLGLGNTRGDVVVFLPKERIVATGDLLVHPSPFGIGSYYQEWITTLGKLDELPADVLFPGHGAVQRDREYLHSVQGLLHSLVDEVGAAVAAGATLEQTQERVTLAAWKEKIAGDDPVKQRAFTAFFVQPAVERAWRQAKGEPDTIDRLE